MGYGSSSHRRTYTCCLASRSRLDRFSIKSALDVEVSDLTSTVNVLHVKLLTQNKTDGAQRTRATATETPRVLTQPADCSALVLAADCRPPLKHSGSRPRKLNCARETLAEICLLRAGPNTSGGNCLHVLRTENLRRV